MPVNLPANAVNILRKPFFAHLVTLMRDGSPQVTPVWVDTDGQHVLVNTAEGRVKTRNVRRDQRVALSVLDPARPYDDWIQVRGKVVAMTTQGADQHADKLTKKYLGRDRYDHRPGEVRVILKVAPEAIGGAGAHD